MKQLKMKLKNKKEGILRMILGTLGASLLGNMIAGKGVIIAREGTARVGYRPKRSSFRKNVIPRHPLTNFEIQMYHQNEPRFNGVYSRDNLPDEKMGHI